MNILIFPNDPFEAYEKKGHNGWYPNYFNPKLFFNNTHLLYLSDSLSSPEVKQGLILNRVKKITRRNVVTKIIDTFRVTLKGINLVKQKKIDLIRAYNTITIPAMLVSKITRKPLVISVHNNYQKEWDMCLNKGRSKLFKIIEKIILNSADEVRCVSTFLCNYVEKRGVNKSKIVYTPNKVKLDRFSFKEKEFKSEKMTTFLFVGRFTKQKNIFTLLKAFKKIKEKYKDVKLVMVGDGEEMPKVKEYVYINKLDNHVEFTGFIPNTELKYYHDKSDCFILPSYFEGFGVVLIEAQASGLPIIGSDIPSTKDIINNKMGNALLFDTYSVEDLVDKMEKIISDKHLRKELSKKSIESAKRFEWDKLEEKEAKYYRKLIRSKSCESKMET